MNEGSKQRALGGRAHADVYRHTHTHTHRADQLVHAVLGDAVHVGEVVPECGEGQPHLAQRALGRLETQPHTTNASDWEEGTPSTTHNQRFRLGGGHSFIRVS
jgi:hypothetical protein